VITVSAISYLNTLPFVYGLENHSIRKDIELQYHTPAQSAKKLSEGTVDIGIVPVATIPYIKNNLILPFWCIGAEKKVASVMLCSGKPLSEIKSVILDSESATSAMLVRILASRYWGISPLFVTEVIVEDTLDISDTYLLIGDKALRHSGEFEFVYDLAQEWIAFSNLPFVFACWTANRELDRDFVSAFCDALELGVRNIEKAVEADSRGFDKHYAIRYLIENVSYSLTDKKKAGLTEFWRLAMAEHMSKVRWFG